MISYRYKLEPYNGVKTRYCCPNCNKKSVYTKYIDVQTNEHVSDTVGKCSRLIKCGYHYTPKQFFIDNEITRPVLKRKNSVTHDALRNKYNLIPQSVLKKSLNSIKPNYFIDYLANLWNYEVAYYLAEKYNIGTSTHWKGSTVFWQVDSMKRIRTGKVMLYNASNGKRIKKPYNHIHWVHKFLKFENFHLKQCYFGEHLLNENKTKPVAIVESEKTAIIASLLLPEFIWLACGSVNNLNYDKTVTLQDRDVVLFPDLKCYDLWESKIKNLSHFASCQVSSLLEQKATKEEKEKGLDLADYLVKFIE